MMYKILLSRGEITVDDEDRNKIVNNIDKNFIVLKSGEVINPSFVQAIMIDHEATRQEIKDKKMIENRRVIEEPKGGIKDIGAILDKYKPDFIK